MGALNKRMQIDVNMNVNTMPWNVFDLLVLFFVFTFYLNHRFKKKIINRISNIAGHPDQGYLSWFSCKSYFYSLTQLG